MIEKVLQPSKLEPYYYKIFNSTDPFEVTVQPHLSVRILLFHTAGPFLNKNQFTALNVGLKKLNEKVFYISVVESESPFNNANKYEGDHWKGKGCSYEEYESIINLSFPYLSNALYSSSGKWGMLISKESHIILGCTQEFWDAFARQYPQWRQDYYDFIAYWKHEKKIWPQGDTEWVREVLNNLTITPKDR